MDMSGLVRFLSEHTPRNSAVFGFDAFVDRIGGRLSGLGDSPPGSMTEFGRRLVERGNKSGAVFLEKMEEVMGGNAPNTSLALGALGAKVTCICALGYPALQPVFSPLRETCTLLSYADPGTCLAVEVGQSKLFFGYNGEMGNMTWETLKERTGLEELRSAYADACLIGLFNWGELQSTQMIWEGLLSEVLPVLPEKERLFFFDFSDVSGRSEGDIALLRETLKRFRRYGKVYVSANCLEAELLHGEMLLAEGAADVFITHGKQLARAIGQGTEVALPTRYQPSPRRLTGGGDSFNAGFCYGLLCGLPLKQCVMIGHAAANCLIRTGKPGTKEQVCQELERCGGLWA